MKTSRKYLPFNIRVPVLELVVLSRTSAPMLDVGRRIVMARNDTSSSLSLTTSIRWYRLVVGASSRSELRRLELRRVVCVCVCVFCVFFCVCLLPGDDVIQLTSAADYLSSCVSSVGAELT